MHQVERTFCICLGVAVVGLSLGLFPFICVVVPFLLKLCVIDTYFNYILSIRVIKELNVYPVIFINIENV